MLITHNLQIISFCPVDNKSDIYNCTITAKRMIKVEDILIATEEVKDMKLYQEEICQELHRRLACRVRLIGYHSGVRTEVICGIETEE